MASSPRYVVGIDIGGTFTDVIALNVETGHTVSAKTPTTPGRFVVGVANSVKALGISLQEVDQIIHGSTTCTNALIERKHAKTGFIGTQGFSDEFDIQRMIRRWSKNSWSAIYDLHQKKPAPFVPRHLRRELDERVAYPGVVVKALDLDEVRCKTKELIEAGATSLAVCLLWSTANSTHERRVKELLDGEFKGVYVSISSEVAPVVREYERMVTTAVNASLMPVMTGYLATIKEELAALGFRGSLLLMQSHGGVADPDVLKERPILTLRGGPVAGVVASNSLGKTLGKRRLISCDIGGTSCDTAIILDHVIPVTDETEVDYYPVKIPTADIRCIGAGGGSIAYVDAGGALRVGPESAGASPGPACYGSGKEPTLTDANLVLGRLSSEEFCGGQIKLDKDAAHSSLESLSRQLGCDVTTAALGVVRVAVANMAESIRLQTIDRGHDPREFSLVGFGGGGPLHGSLLAEASSIPEVIIPLQPGVFSTVGMVVAELGYHGQAAYLQPLTSVDPHKMEGCFRDMEAAGAAMLRASSANRGDIRFSRSAAMRYALQEWELQVGIDVKCIDHEGLEQIKAAFHTFHRARYGFSREDKPVEFVTLYVDSSLPTPPLRRDPPLQGDGDPAGAQKGTRAVYVDERVGFVEISIYDRVRLEAGDVIDGPCIIEELTSTTFVQPGWQVTVDPVGNLIVRSHEVGR
jgi:N-methylhydantoinase A